MKDYYLSLCTSYNQYFLYQSRRCPEPITIVNSVRTVRVAGGDWGRQRRAGWRLGAPTAVGSHLIRLDRLGLGLCPVLCWANNDLILFQISTGYL
jgi:hypothetical protein